MKIVVDSRKVKSGDIFFALPGKRTDQTFEYGKQAIESGASAIISWKSTCDKLQELYPAEKHPKIKFISSANPRALLAKVYQELYMSDCCSSADTKFCAMKFCAMKFCAITGSKGKTSVAYFMSAIISRIKAGEAGNGAGYIGTLGVEFFDNTHHRYSFGKNIGHELTSPDTEIFYQALDIFQQLQCEHVIYETTSIGLDAQRSMVDIDVGVFTNFTGDDHLIYHYTVENYLACKELIFNKVKNLVIHSDYIDYANQYSIEHLYTYGKAESFCYINGESHEYGMNAQLYIENKLICNMILPLFGKFQLDNLAGAVAACIALGISIEDIVKALKSYENFPQNNTEKILYTVKKNQESRSKILNLECSIERVVVLESENSMQSPEDIQNQKIQSHTVENICVPGRMEYCGKYKEGVVIVDFAHTPNSLKHSLQSLREHGYKKVIIVFGCGGDRDAEKRPIMGKISCDFADTVIVTDDNPRTEDPAEIRNQIYQGCYQKEKVNNIEDREKAIEFGMSYLEKDAVLIIAGKGHEDYQIIGTEKIHFSDQECVKRIINSSNN